MDSLFLGPHHKVDKLWLFIDNDTTPRSPSFSSSGVHGRTDSPYSCPINWSAPVTLVLPQGLCHDSTGALFLPTACNGFDFCSELSARLWKKTELWRQRQAEIPTFPWNDFREVSEKNSCSNLLPRIWIAHRCCRGRFEERSGRLFCFHRSQSSEASLSVPRKADESVCLGGLFPLSFSPIYI